MNKLTLAAALGASCLALAACGGGEADHNNMAADNMSAAAEAEGAAGAEGNAEAAAAGTAAAFPAGARIVEENGATWRVDADGTRVRLGDADSRIVVENGVRYRVDPGGARVRIDEKGLGIDVDTPDLTPDLGPDVDLGVNKKGNLDVDVKDKSDGNEGPN
jgi:uncharacterized membrane protein